MPNSTLNNTFFDKLLLKQTSKLPQIAYFTE